MTIEEINKIKVGTILSNKTVTDGISHGWDYIVTNVDNGNYTLVLITGLPQIDDYYNGREFYLRTNHLENSNILYIKEDPKKEYQNVKNEPKTASGLTDEQKKELKHIYWRADGIVTDIVRQRLHFKDDEKMINEISSKIDTFLVDVQQAITFVLGDETV